MTGREKAACEDTRRLVFARDGYRCTVCGGSIMQYGTPQAAHRIGDTKVNRRLYGKAIIHHPVNLRSTCCLKCNSAEDVGKSLLAHAAVLEEIGAYEAEKV